MGCVAGLVIAKTFALTLPFRIRPIHDSLLSLNLAYGLRPSILAGWSAFPSDHAVMFFALSTSYLYISRVVGFVALSYALIVICLPRIYLGLHYPSDVIGGAMLGIALALILNRRAIRSFVGNHGIAVHDKHPAFFYTVFFFLTYQIATMFGTFRAVIDIIM